jgi:hypothetical protein
MILVIVVARIMVIVVIAVATGCGTTGEARSEETSVGLHDLDPSLCLYSPNLGDLKIRELRLLGILGSSL